MLLTFLCATFLFVCAICSLPPQTYMVPMRDGIELKTVVILNSTSPLPVILIRTPYGTDGEASLQDYYTLLGYNTVSQDFRGMWGSQGTFDFWNHSSPDAFDTMQWIVSQNWSNQDIFTQGISANGIACYLQAEAQPPWLKGQMVVFGTGELYKTVFQGGAYRYSLINGWLNLVNAGSYEPLVLANEQYSSFWEMTNDDLYWGDVKWPAVHQSGWYDIFSQQQLDAFNAYSTLSQTPYNAYNFLVVGPGGHCAQGGQVPWPQGTLDNDLGTLISDMLFAVVSGQKGAKPFDVSFIYYYVMGPILTEGEIGNYWTNASAFPTPKYVNLYLNDGGLLNTVPPTTEELNVTYIYNPANPVPTYGGNNLLLPQCGPWDQQLLEQRSDVISFTTPPFSETFAITGHVYAYLYVSSNATDTDFTVKYTDVYPNGTSMLIQDGILRMKWRENNTTPVFMVSGEIYPITIDLWSTSYIFNTGHALRISISSSNAPRFAPNLNNGNPLSDPGTPLIAENTIYFGQKYPAYIELPVVPIPQPTTFLEKIFLN